MVPQLAIVAVLLAACGDDDAGPGDGGVDADAVVLDAMPAEVSPPEPPAPPVLTPCPDGWTETDESPPTCTPWAPSDSPTCTGATARFPSGAACERLGTPCPSDLFPADAPADALYVSAETTTAGDGSRSAPFATISEALAVAGTGDTVAIAVGAYEEALDVPSGVTLLGACTEGTSLSSPTARVDRGVITAQGSDIVVRNLRITSSEQGGVWAVGADRSIRLEDVLIEDVRVAGIDAEEGAAVEASRVVIRRSRPTVFGVFGRGLTIEMGASATMEQLVVEDCVEFGVLSYGDATRVALADAAVLRTNALPNGVAGAGLVATMGAELTAERVVVEESTEVGVAAVGAGTLTTRDAVIRGTRSRPMEADRGYGATAQGESSLTLERTAISDCRVAGAFVSDSMATFRDLVVTDIDVRESDSALGRGIVLQDLSMVEGRRIHVARVFENGIFFGYTLPSFGTLEDVTIIDVRLDGVMGRFGRGLTIQGRSEVTLSRLRIERVAESGASIIGRATISDLVVRGVSTSRLGTTPGGFGLAVFEGAEVTLARSLIEDTFTVGIIASDPETALDATDCLVSVVSGNDCDEATLCAAGGHALAAYRGARVSIAAFSLGPADLCGIHVADGGTVSARNGTVSESAIGACVQSEPQVIADLQDDVLYLDNGTPLQATTLLVPEVGGEIAEED